MTQAESPVHLRDVLAVRPFRWLLVAAVQSQVGDQVARVALAVLVYERTKSPLATSLVFALTILPAVLGGVVLGSWVDRWSRRDVMITCDVLRAALLAVMAAVRLPVGGVYALVAAAVLLGAPFNSAQVAALPELVGRDRFPASVGLLRSCDQVASLVGYGVGGVLVAGVGARAGLAWNAASFALSAALLAAGVKVRAGAGPVPDVTYADEVAYADAMPGLDAAAGMAGGTGARVDRPTLRAACRAILEDRRLRLLIPIACLVGWFVVPEALAAPYAAQVGGGAMAVGLLLAVATGGAALGSLVVVWRVPATVRQRLMGPLAVAAGLPLVACWATPSLPVSLVLWFVSGMACSFVIIATSMFSITVHAPVRGTAIALAGACLTASQGITALLGGAIADQWSAGAAIGICGLAGTVCAAVLSVAWRWAGPTPASTGASAMAPA